MKPADYVRWVEDEGNGLRVTRNMGEYAFTLQYKPVDYMIAQEARSNEIAPEYLAKRRQQLGNDLHFNFIIRSNGSNTALKEGTDEAGYFMRTGHFFNEGMDDFKLYSSSDTFDCNFCHLEQTYGLASESVIVLAFEPRSGQVKQPLNESLTMVYDDQVFGVGQLKVKVDGGKMGNVVMGE
ncbi:hypothetical protein [Pedobacter insulae]|nr:hypothetical protein [Pedobacter insulae]